MIDPKYVDLIQQRCDVTPGTGAGMKSLSEIFPRGSKSFLKANPNLSATITRPNACDDSTGILERQRMNKTEAEYALILEAMRHNGEILRWEFEGVTLRFAGVKYTPDFVVFQPLYESGHYKGVKFIEVKGGYTKGKFERAVERFRHAKTFWPEFTFELHQKTKEAGWRQIV